MKIFAHTHARHASTRAGCTRPAALLLGLLCLVPSLSAQERDGTRRAARDRSASRVADRHASPPPPQKLTREGVSVEFSVEQAVRRDKAAPAAPLEGETVTLTFRISEATGTPLAGLRPAAWLDLRDGEAPTNAGNCRAKVQAFLQSSLSRRADVDLNKYYILALNQEPNISVIDPLLGLGATKLLTLVMLKSPGTDWVMSGDQRRLFVSMPLVNQVAVVNTETWKVAANVDAGQRPARLRLQRDGKYLWVGEGEGGLGNVTVIDTETLKVAARIQSGAGPHDIVISDDDSHAFIANRRDGTLSVVSTSRLEKVRDIKTGDSPVAVAFSALSGAAYVAHESSGEVVVVDAARHEIVSRITTRPGLVSLRFTPDGRYGFAVNHKDSTVHIFDASTSRLLHTLPVGASPDQVSFTKRFAYIRSMGSDEVTTIRLAGIGGAGMEQAMGRFPGGQRPPHLAHKTALAPAVISAPEEGAVLVANPADQIIYYYTEGMAAPMGNFQNYRRQPLALAVWDASLRETEPGIYRAKARLSMRGTYDVAFLLDSPRVVNCFQLIVSENPEQEKTAAVPIKVESLMGGPSLPVGTQVHIRFRVIDVATGRPKSGLADMGVLTFLAPGIWQQRDWARSIGGGVYEVAVTMPQEGVYYVFFQCPSLGVSYSQLPNLILSARRTVPGAGAAPQNPHATSRP